MQPLFPILAAVAARGGGQFGGNNYNSPERRTRLLELIDVYTKKMEAINFDKMSVYGKVDYILFKRIIDDAKVKLQEEQADYSKIVKFLPFSDHIYNLERSRRSGLNVNGEEIAKKMNDIIKEVRKAKESLKNEESIDNKLATFAFDAVKGLQGALKSQFDFYNGYDPMFTWWVPKTYADLDSTLGAYATAVRAKGKNMDAKPKDDGSGILGVSVGRDELIRQLTREYIPYTPEELIEIANKEFAYCDAELLKASKEMGFGDNWKAAQEKVKNTYVAPGKQPEEMFISINSLLISYAKMT
jgi:hypothetical protein